MNQGGIIAVLLAIVAVAMVTTIVRNPNSARVIGAGGNAFSSSLRASMGR